MYYIHTYLCMYAYMYVHVCFVDLENSNLRKILQQLQHDSTDWQFDKEMDATDKRLSEEELLPLTEMNHSLPGDEIIPYYEFINLELQKMTKTEVILELLDVDMETKHTFNFGNRKISLFTHLTERVTTASSAQVSAVDIYTTTHTYTR